MFLIESTTGHDVTANYYKPICSSVKWHPLTLLLGTRDPTLFHKSKTHTHAHTHGFGSRSVLQ